MAGKISLYEEVAKDPAATTRFRDAMEYFSMGEGYEVSSLVENYDWASLGNGTVVDVGAFLLLVLVLVLLTSNIVRGC